MKKRLGFLIISIISALLISWIIAFENVEAASYQQKNALKMAQQCEYYIEAYASNMPKGTKHIKLTKKNKLTISGTVDFGTGNAMQNCQDLFGKKISASVLPIEKNWETNLKNYANLDKLVVRLDNGDIVCNLGDTGDYYLKTKLRSFKKSGNTYILKVNNYNCLDYGDGETTLKFATTTFRLKTCLKSKFGLKITGISIQKLTNESIFF